MWPPSRTTSWEPSWRLHDPLPCTDRGLPLQLQDSVPWASSLHSCSIPVWDGWVVPLQTHGWYHTNLMGCTTPTPWAVPPQPHGWYHTNFIGCTTSTPWVVPHQPHGLYHTYSLWICSVSAVILNCPSMLVCLLSASHQ